MNSLTDLAARGPVTVIGGGPAGTVMATLLAGHGLDVTLYESRPDLRLNDIDAGRSINMALAERGIVALRHIGAMEAIDKIAIPMAGRMIHADGGQSFQPYGSRPHEVIYSVSRKHMNAILLDVTEATGRVDVRFNQRLRAIDLDAHRMQLTDEADGDRPYDAPFGVLFGADGTNSPVRAATLEANGGEVDDQPLSHGYRELEIPPTGDGGFQLDPNALHIWPRGKFMLIALPNPEGDFTVTLFLPNEPDPADAEIGSFAELDSPKAVESFFGREFPDFVPLIPDLATQFFTNPLGDLSTIRTDGWSYRDVSVVLGDAAHAIVPFHGQGMNAALESAMTLDALLQANRDDVAAAFAAFQVQRKPDTDAIADMALENYIEMRSGVVDPDYLIKRELALELERRWPKHISPRYGMVMFSTIPCRTVQLRALEQGEILRELTAGITDLADVDWARAAKLVEALTPLDEL